MVPPRLLLRRVQAGLLVLCTVAGAASEGTGIDAERAAESVRFEREQAECRARFAANSCLGDARDRHRRALAALQERQRGADEARRRDRSAARQQAVERKRAAVAAREVASAAVQAPAAAVASAAAASEPAPRRPQAANERRRAAAAAQAAERASAAQRLQQDIQADQARIRRRLERRAAEGKVSQPLPGASAPR